MPTDNTNVINILNQDLGKAMIERYLDKVLLERPIRDGVLCNKAYSTQRGIPQMGGEFIKLTQKKGVRRPSTMLSPGGGGSDPLSGAKLGTNQMLVPMEWIHEFLEIATVSQKMSWLDLKTWAKEDLPDALKLRCHELAQNALLVGHMAPGQYAADGSESVAFDQAAEATVSIYDTAFTFKSAPTVYAGGTADFDSFAGTERTSLSELHAIATRLGMSGAKKINGKYVCVLSRSMMDDLLFDPNLNVVIRDSITGGSKPMIKGLEDQWLGSHGQLAFVRDDWCFTETSGIGNENKRAEWGDVHSAFILGAGALGTLALGGEDATQNPKFKIQDVTKVGHSTSMGYLVPHQVATINPNFAAVYKSPVSTSLPNNHSGTNKQLPFGGETIG